MVTAIVTGLVGVACAAAGLWAGRASVAGRLSRLESQNRRVAEELVARERTSREEHQVQDLILGSMQDGVLLFDADGRTAFANGSLAVHLGARPDSLAHVFPSRLQETIREAAEQRETKIAEVETAAPTRWLRATATPAGNDRSVLVVISDITDVRRLDAVRRDFVANASHELKTPAASIQAAAETLMHVAHDDPEAVPRFAEQLEREAVRLSRIVADLLDLSRLESGSDLAERVRMDAVVREESERFQDAARGAGLTLATDAPDPAAVRGSARDLSLLVRNLLDNAIRYTKTGGAIHTTVACENGTVVLRVEDTGVGIPTKELPRVFERFYRVDRARSRETGGTGLGLAIVRHVAENHGGTVTVRSELGQGSTFEVRLPSASADVRTTGTGDRSGT